MQETPKGSRLHIAIFGRRNAGKSSLINALTNQDIALVSDVPGTTTDPVYKAMEILPMGPVMLIDTAGIDDVGELGLLRVERTMQVLNKADLAVMVVSGDGGVTNYERDLKEAVAKRGIPLVAVINKIDEALPPKMEIAAWQEELGLSLLAVSAKTGQGMEELKKELIRQAPDDWEGAPIIGDLLTGGDLAILVVPIDTAAPKGRLILPQVQTIRDILDHDASCIVVKERELRSALDNLRHPPKIVVTDSQEFEKVAADTPEDVPLTSFSILMARHKGDLVTLAAGAKAIDSLKASDRILIAEGCTHHRQCEDLGTVKIPRWISNYTGKDLKFAFTSGGTFPEDLSQYALVQVKLVMRMSKTQHRKAHNVAVQITAPNGLNDKSRTDDDRKRVQEQLIKIGVLSQF